MKKTSSKITFDKFTEKILKKIAKATRVPYRMLIGKPTHKNKS